MSKEETIKKEGKYSKERIEYSNNYNRENYKGILIRFNKKVDNDWKLYQDLIKMVEEKHIGLTVYLKNLIKNDIEINKNLEINKKEDE